ncbi:MAG: ArsA family ATPase [Asgard group archaeon]|nr:ArsA family ATPase [Asgard group archaeon]
MTLETILKKDNLTYLFLGGKGGVGKTICASAISIELAKHFDRVLIVSTDPAHSLSDCFDQNLSGGEPVRIDNIDGNLFGLELNAEKGLERFKEISALGMPGMGASSGMPGMGQPSPDMGAFEEDKKQPFENIPEENEGDMFGGNNMQDALGLGSDLLGMDSIPPGSDEAFALGKLLELIESSDFDAVVFDTAPTGHTLRLLSLPDYLDSFVGRMLKMRLRFGNLFKSIRGFFGGGRDEPDDNTLEMLEKLKEVITKARIELADEAKTEFIPVTIPTMMALYETERLTSTLKEYSIPVEHIIINQLIPESKDCPFCARRYEIQEKTMLTIKQYFGDYDLVEVPMVPQEIRGLEQLKKLAKVLFSK